MTDKPNPEKAGVGGSTPSLATIIPIAWNRFSIQYLKSRLQGNGLVLGGGLGAGSSKVPEINGLMPTSSARAQLSSAALKASHEVSKTTL